MTQEEARAELARRYRVRIVLTVEHAGRAAYVQGSTMTAAVEELGDAVGSLLGHMLVRLVERLEHSGD